MNRKLVMLVAALALTVPALAQETDQTSAATLAELRAEAVRLTALAQVPEAGRAEAEALLTRVDALLEATRAQEVGRLQAYIAALRSGDSPSVAEEVASSAVSAGAVDLAREREVLQSDVQAFLETYPDAAGVFQRAALGGIGARGVAVFGAGSFDEVLGVGPLRTHTVRIRPGPGGSGGFSMAVPFGFDAPGFAGPSWESFRQGRQSAP